jgi:thiamine-phosphate pyrophosphorylase
MNKLSGLYLVTPDWDDTDRLLEVTELALKSGANILQYRHKTASDALRRRQATALLELCRRYHVPLIINDHLNLCLELDADGIHVGGTDAPVQHIRNSVGTSKIVGASCYGDLGVARAAHQHGASYVAFGGFFPSRVKKYPVTTPVDIVAKSKTEIPLPVVVIGGMTAENSEPLVAGGADMVAAISSVYQSDDGAATVRKFLTMF